MDNPYVASLIFPLIMILLALFVYAHRPGRIQNRVFLVIGCSAALFILPIFAGYLFVDAPEITTRLNRLAVFFTLFQVAIHLYFAAIFPEVHIERPLVTLAVICGPVFLLAPAILGTDLFVKSMVVRAMGERLVMMRETGMFYRGVYAPLVVAYILMAFAVFYYQYRTATSGITRKQVLYTALAMAGGGAVATVSCIVLPLAGETRYYQMGPLFMTPLYVTIMAVNIVSLRAMDIDQLLAKLLLWGLSLGVITVFIGFGVHELIGHPHRYSVTGGTLLMLGCFMAGLVYMISVQPLISTRLQRKSLTYAVIVDRFHNGIRHLKTVDHLASLICTTVETTLSPENISVFLRETGRGTFVLKQGVRYDGPAAIDIDKNQLQRIPLFDTVIEKEQVEVNDRYAPYRETGRNYFARFRCVIVVPIIYEERILGVMNIGARSRGFYKRAEIKFLEKLMTGINVAFSNAMLMDHIESINTSLTRFVPEQCLHLMGHEEITEVALGDGVQQEMTILFCDVKGFAGLSEQMGPRENFQFINTLLRYMSPVIRDNNGFIDKYMGDAVMALFPGSPRDGVRAAVGMLEALQRYNREERINGNAPVEVGIGVHTGMLMLGTIGEDRRMESTVISDAVNQAQRIERMTRLFGVSLIISDTVADRLDTVDRQAVRHLGRVTVKGRQQPLSLYERFDADPEDLRTRKLATRREFEKGVDLYYRGNTGRARDCFQAILTAGPDDPACRSYLNNHDCIVQTHA